MAKPFRKPPRDVVERIIHEESRRLRARVNDVIGNSRRRRAVNARCEAVLRILSETGCSERGLAMVWGISYDQVKRATRRQRELGEGSIYDPQTVARFRFLHGIDRTLDIIAGKDRDTNGDLAKWNKLISGARP